MGQQQRGVAVVTGASSGIGSAIVTRLLDDGWSVIGLSRSLVEGRPDNFRSLQVDVSHFPALRSALASISEVQAIVHAAGLMHTARVGALDASHGAAMWAVHVGAAEVLVDQLADKMSAGGRIVLIGSRAAAGVAGGHQRGSEREWNVRRDSFDTTLIPKRLHVNLY